MNPLATFKAKLKVLLREHGINIVSWKFEIEYNSYLMVTQRHYPEGTHEVVVSLPEGLEYGDSITSVLEYAHLVTTEVLKKYGAYELRGADRMRNWLANGQASTSV